LGIFVTSYAASCRNFASSDSNRVFETLVVVSAQSEPKPPSFPIRMKLRVRIPIKTGLGQL